MSNSKTRNLSVSLVLSQLLLGAVISVNAATIEVSSVSGGQDMYNCSLHDAIIAANTDTVEGACIAGSGADIINIAAGPQIEITTPAVTGSPYGDAGLPEIESTITIMGNGVTITRNSSADPFRILSVVADGNLTLEQSTISGGDASTGSGGGILCQYAQLQITDSTVTNNRAEYSGGIEMNGCITSISNSTISDNNVTSWGGGLYNRYGGTLTLTDSIIIGNNTTASSAGGGAGIENYQATASIEGCTFMNNTTEGQGGGIDNYDAAMQILDTTVSGNSAGDTGGGISNYGASLNVENTSIKDNNATYGGGGMANTGGGYAPTDLFVSSSTISGNSANIGGGIFNDEDTTGQVYNTTISNNTAVESGGGILTNNGIFTLSSSTLTQNNSTNGVAGIEVLGEVHIINSILAGNNGSDGDGDEPSTWINNIIDVDPVLGPLANNGGPTLTHALLKGSPAIDYVGDMPTNAEIETVWSSTSDVVGAEAYLASRSTKPTPTPKRRSADSSKALIGWGTLPVPTKINAQPMPMEISLDQRGYERTDSTRDIGAYEYKTLSTSDLFNTGHNALLWHNSVTGGVNLWSMNGYTNTTEKTVVPSSNTNLIPKGIGDFTGDGLPDIIVHNQNSGQVRMWEMNSMVDRVANIPLLNSSNTNLQVAGVGDFDQDGDNDIATFNVNSGALVIWEMDGTTKLGNRVVLSGANLNLAPRGVGDMNNDGIPDIVLRNSNSGAVRVWTMNANFTRKGNEYVTGSSNTNLELRGITDINADGYSDILNYNTNTGKLRAWIMDGSMGILRNDEVTQELDLDWSVRN